MDGMGISGNVSLDMSVSNIAGISKYDELSDKPKINGVEVSGSKTLADYGIAENYEALSDKPKINNIEVSGSKSLNDYGIASIDDILSINKQVGVYENVSEMISDINVKKYSLALTKHFYDDSDNGGSIYAIVDSATANAYDTFSLHDGRFAKFVGPLSMFVVDCFGARSDDDTIDNAPIINYVLSTYKIAKLFGHYHIGTCVKVGLGQTLTTDGYYGNSYAYMHKESDSANTINSFAKFGGVLYTDDSFSDSQMVLVNDGSISKILVTNVSASPTHIYVPSFNGIVVYVNNGIASCYCHHIAASGCNVGIDFYNITGFQASNFIGSACITGIRIIASDCKLSKIEANTNIHMAPTITPASSNGGYSSTLTGIFIIGGDNQFSDIRAEWCYYGIDVACYGNHFTNVLIDWCDIGIKYVPNISERNSQDLWSCVAAFVRTYYVDCHDYQGTNRIFMTGCSFQTSDGSAHFVESGENVKPTGTPLYIYPSQDTGFEFTITSSDLSKATTANYGNYQDVISYNPYSYSSITNCKLKNAIDGNVTAHINFVGCYTNVTKS